MQVQGRRITGVVGSMRRRVRDVRARLRQGTIGGVSRAQAKFACARGQGTTEYAILVGVLVVIAILAITVFRPKLEELWAAISDGINSL